MGCPGGPNGVRSVLIKGRPEPQPQVGWPGEVAGGSKLAAGGSKLAAGPQAAKRTLTTRPQEEAASAATSS